MFQPLDDRVVISPIEEEETTIAGIFIPTQSATATQRGIIEAVGPGKLLQDGTRAEMQVQVGEEVLFSTYAGMEVTLADNTKLKIVKEEDIFAKA